MKLFVWMAAGWGVIMIGRVVLGLLQGTPRK